MGRDGGQWREGGTWVVSYAARRGDGGMSVSKQTWRASERKKRQQKQCGKARPEQPARESQSEQVLRCGVNVAVQSNSRTPNRKSAKSTVIGC